MAPLTQRLFVGLFVCLFSVGRAGCGCNSLFGHGNCLQGDEGNTQWVLGHFLHLRPHFLQQVLLLGTVELDGVDLSRTS